MTRYRIFVVMAAASLLLLPLQANSANTAVKINGNIVLNKDNAGNDTGVIFSNGDVMTAAPRDGKSIISGSGSPITGNVVANIGDFYIDTTNHLLYGPYAGSWPAGVSLVGPTGQTGPQGPANQVPWVVVTGTSQVAAENTGYITMNDALTSITLPASPAVGSVVRIAGIGYGGWRTELNAGQYISSNGGYNVPPAAMGLNWIQRGGQEYWGPIATSNDGTKLVATSWHTGLLYTSINGGIFWTVREIIPGEGNVYRSWSSLASSSNGTKLVAAVGGGQIYTSADSGATWTPREVIPGEGAVSRNWSSLASSSDGSKLAATINGGSIYTSSDSGSTWTLREIVPGEGSVNRVWPRTISSSDGLKLAAVEWGGLLYTSDNSGITWTVREITPGEGSISRTWVDIASSNDGSKLAALTTDGGLYTSANSGATWTPRTILPAGTTNLWSWGHLASSGDGMQLIVSAASGPVFVSTDGGATWEKQSKYLNSGANAVAISGDGSKYFSTNDFIYIANTGEAVTSGPRITSYQEAAIELLYVGSGRFTMLNYAGNFTREY